MQCSRHCAAGLDNRYDMVCGTYLPITRCLAMHCQDTQNARQQPQVQRSVAWLPRPHPSQEVDAKRPARAAFKVWREGSRPVNVIVVCEGQAEKAASVHRMYAKQPSGGSAGWLVEWATKCWDCFQKDRLKAPVESEGCLDTLPNNLTSQGHAIACQHANTHNKLDSAILSNTLALLPQASQCRTHATTSSRYQTLLRLKTLDSSLLLNLQHCCVAKSSDSQMYGQQQLNPLRHTPM